MQERTRVEIDPISAASAWILRHAVWSQQILATQWRSDIIPTSHRKSIQISDSSVVRDGEYLIPSDRKPGGVLVVAKGTPRTFRSMWVGRHRGKLEVRERWTPTPGCRACESGHANKHLVRCEARRYEYRLKYGRNPPVTTRRVYHEPETVPEGTAPTHTPVKGLRCKENDHKFRVTEEDRHKHRIVKVQ